MDKQHKILLAIRNPLSIIAVFVLLIEGLATIALANSLLTESQRHWFVVFCTIFPVFVLAIFFVITWFKPVNLYGPQDYTDDKVFLMTMKQGKLDEEVNEIVKAEGTSEEERGTIRAVIIQAEQKALNELQKEFHSSSLSEVRSKDGKYLYDGIILKGRDLVYVEVKYLPTGTLRLEVLNQIRRFGDTVGNSSEKIVAIVTKRPLEADEKTLIENSVKKVCNNVDFRFYTL